MKKILTVLILLLFSSLAFASWDFNQTVKIKPQVNVIVDAVQQKFTVTIGTASNQYFCTSDQNQTLDWETNVQIDQNALDLNYVLSPLLTMLDSNNTKILQDLNIQVEKMRNLNESCDINAFKEEIVGFKNAIDATVSERLTAFDTKLTETILPKQAELDSLRSENKNALEGQRQCLSDINVFQTNISTERIAYQGKIELRDTVVTILAILLFLVVGFMAFFLVREGYLNWKMKQKIGQGEDS